jgi:hypothetical protein
LVLFSGTLLLALAGGGTADAAEQSSCTENVSTNRKTCRITEPTVTRPETFYPGILFRPGDRVLVSARGCVQTGGSGATWKHYVYPSGPNAGSLYHGRIRIPGATPGSQTVRFKDVNGLLLTVPANVGLGAAFLTLGYEDDNYSDNGYYDHDNGTENQCAGTGPADVQLSIAHPDNLFSYGPFSCGPYALTYRVTSLSTGEFGGVRCVRVLTGDPIFVWYGEGRWGGNPYRHLGMAYHVENFPLGTRTLVAAASDMYGNGEAFNNSFPGNLIPEYDPNEWPAPRVIRMKGAWNEQWTLVSGVDHTALPRPQVCGSNFDQYLAFDLGGVRRGLGLRCMLRVGPNNVLPLIRPFFSNGDWNGTTYTNLGLYNDEVFPITGHTTGSAVDLCGPAFGSFCNQFPLRSVTFTPVSPRGFNVTEAWNEVWR